VVDTIYPDLLPFGPRFNLRSVHTKNHLLGEVNHLNEFQLLQGISLRSYTHDTFGLQKKG
jgi:hypothetical protein